MRFCCPGWWVNGKQLPIYVPAWLMHEPITQDKSTPSWSHHKKFPQAPILNCLQFQLNQGGMVPSFQHFQRERFVFFGERRAALPSLHPVIHHILAHWRSILPEQWGSSASYFERFTHTESPFPKPSPAQGTERELFFPPCRRPLSKLPTKMILFHAQKT